MGQGEDFTSSLRCLTLEQVEGTIIVYNGFIEHYNLEFSKVLNKGLVIAEGSPLPEAGLQIYKLCIRFKYFSLCADVRGIGHSVELFMSSL